MAAILIAPPTDEELVLRARAGEVAALGVLLERHRPALIAAALRVLHDGPAAHDAVQETCLVALRRIGEVRQPTAVAAWLHAVVRTVCLEHLRRERRVVPLDLEAAEALADPGPSLEEHVERSALGGWVWAAMAELPESMRAAAMLRFFGRWSSYEEIALILGVPVGTVRSRLAHARGRLADALLATTESAGSAARELTQVQERDFGAALADLNRGAGYEHFAAAFAPDVRIEFDDGTAHRGYAALRGSLDGDAVAGVKLHLTRVLASPTVTILEGDFENPRDAPGRCPPATCQVHFRRDGLTRHVRLYFASRPTEE